MRNSLLVLACAVAVVLFGVACGKNPVSPDTPTLIDTNYSSITIQPASQHMKIGDTVIFVATGGDGVYEFNLYTSNSSSIYGSTDCACMFNAVYSGNTAKLTLVDPTCTGGWKFSKISLNVSSPNDKGWPGTALIVID